MHTPIRQDLRARGPLSKTTPKVAAFKDKSGKLQADRSKVIDTYIVAIRSLQNLNPIPMSTG